MTRPPTRPGPHAAHVDQLAPVINRWKDTIHALQAGIVGAWGEWHGESYAIDKTAVLNKIVGTLLPPGTYLQMRLPDYKNLLPSSHPAYSRIGIHNDAVFGKIPNKGYGTGGLDAGSAQWNQLVTQAPYAPQDGELYYSTWNQTNNVYCDGYEAIRQFSEHRFTTFSHYHGYWDAGGTAQTAMGRWKNLAVTPAWLASNGIVGSPAWFTDRNRQPIARNAFAFVEAHLGYRLEAQDVTIHSSGAPGKHRPCLAVAEKLWLFGGLQPPERVRHSGRRQPGGVPDRRGNACRVAQPFSRAVQRRDPSCGIGWGPP